ncbi:hypothetical protein AAHC03_026967 [Spirometra sp. Aus1]
MSQKSILYVPLRLIKLTALSFRRNPKGAIYLQILSSRTASPSPPVTNGKRRRLTVVSDDSSTDSTEQELTSVIETSSPTIASECAHQSMTVFPRKCEGSQSTRHVPVTRLQKGRGKIAQDYLANL